MTPVEQAVSEWVAAHPGGTSTECAEDTGIKRGTVYAAARRMGLEFAKRRRLADDLTGSRFGRLVVTGYDGPDRGDGTRYRCLCDCGRETVVGARSLKTGNTRSCGCGEAENRSRIAERCTVHQDGTNLAAIGSGRLRPDNTSGTVGVRPNGKGWQAFIDFQGSHYALGTFASIDAAAEARLEAERLLHDPVRSKHGLPLADELRAIRDRWAEESGHHPSPPS